MGLLTGEQLIDQTTLPREQVDLGAGHVFVREMTGEEFQALVTDQEAAQKDGRDLDVVALWVLYCACDDKGNRLWSGEGALETVRKIPITTLKKISEAAQRINGMDEKAETQAKN